MSIRRKFSNTSDFVEPLQSTILCEYYLWVRWCNIREINGYYIYNGMKGNKLSFVHQQNSNLIIYFHTISTDIHSSNQTVENTYSFFSSNSYFMAQSSIPENREDDNDSEIKLNLAMDSPSSSGPSQSQSHSNDSTPCSSPPQSPNHKIPLRLTPKNSIDEYLYNHWVIKHDKYILYYTKDKDINSIDNEYPPSYGWKYNEKNQSSLPKQYNLINFGAPPPGITRIPIIPQPMITFMDNDNINHKNGIISHGNNLKNGQTNDTNTNISPKYNQTTPIPFDWPVHYIDAIFKLEPKQPLPFDITIENPNSNILQISNINTDSIPYKVGLRQGDILISLNEEEITNEFKLSNIDTESIINMTVCRRIYDHIMIIVNSCGNNKCDGKYYFHHLDEFNSPVFMQDMEQNIIIPNDSTDDYKINSENNYPMIIRKAHYVNDTGESLWTISNKTEDFYVGLSIDMMPPNTNWECVIDTYNKYDSPMLIFYNGNRKMKLTKNNDAPPIKAELLESFAPPIKSYLAPISNYNNSSHYRRPSWKKNTTPWDTWDMELIIEDEEMNEKSVKSELDINTTEWKTKYFTLYENLEDLNCGFYEYWLICNKHKIEIEELKDIISQFSHRFITVRKELFEQKRREEDLLDKINSLQTHSRQVSSISKLFDDDYKLDIEELQQLQIDSCNNNTDTDNIEDEKKRRDSVKINNQKLDKMALKTEIDDLNVQLKAKDIKIRELEIDITSWQETHSQIYDAFQSATKKYGQQVNKFNEQDKEIEKLQQQILNIQKTRNSIDKNDIDSDSNNTQKIYTDIDAELEYNSDSSSSISDADIIGSDDSIGGGTHVRRSSKPWMQIKQKWQKKQAKIEAEKNKNQPINIETTKSNNDKMTSIHTPVTPVTPVTPLSTGNHSPPNSNNMLLSVGKGNNKDGASPSPYLKTLKSQIEDTDIDIIESDIDNNTGHNADNNTLMSRTERLTQLGLLTTVGSAMTLHTDISTITPDIDVINHKGYDGGSQRLSEQIPTHPTLHTAKARSKLGDSILNGYDSIGNPVLSAHLAQSHLGGSMQLNSKMNLLAFRDSNASLFGRDSTINMNELIKVTDQANNSQKWENECKQLQIEKEEIIESKIKLLLTTSYEIQRLKNIINVVLNYPKEENIKSVIAQMLTSN